MPSSLHNNAVPAVPSDGDVAMRNDSTVHSNAAGTDHADEDEDSAIPAHRVEETPVAMETGPEGPAEVSPSDPLIDEEDRGVFEWEIQGFTRIDEQKKYSEEHEVGGYSWRLLIFPRGNNKSESLAVYLDCPDAEYLPQHRAPRAWFELTIINHLDAKLNQKKDTTHVFSPRETDWGFTTFIPLKELHSGSGFLVSDTIKLRVDIRVERDDKRMYDARRTTGYVGFKNQGATCYMNSMLQTLFHVPYFRKAVYHVPAADTDSPSSSIPLALQKVFFQLQYSPSTVSTKDLTKSFGWGTYDAFQQHDVQEFNRVLCDRLEERMKGTPVENVINDLFQGQFYNYIECVNVDYKSTREEKFLDLQLDIKGCANVYESFDKYIEVETMDGDNKYHAEGHGLQDARRGVLFDSFPPVLQLHLKRFEYDYIRDVMLKINDRYEFPDELDLDVGNRKYLSPKAREEAESTRERNVYKLHSVLVHSGGLHGGHYYAFIRPDGEKWYRFDDERVTLEDHKRAVQDQYGGEDDGGGSGGFGGGAMKLAKSSNAYMLVYIRKSDWERVMCPVSSKDLSEHLRARLQREQDEKEQRRQEKMHAHKFVVFRVATDDDLKQQIGTTTFFDIVNHANVRSFKVPKATLFTEFQQQVEEALGVPANDQRFWFFAPRPNNTSRPFNVLPRHLASLPVKFTLRAVMHRLLQSMQLAHKQPHKPLLNTIDLYVTRRSTMGGDKIEDPDLGIIPAQHVLLFLKHYNAERQRLEYLYSVVVPAMTELSKIALHAANACGIDTSASLPWVFEESKSQPPYLLPIDLNADPPYVCKSHQLDQHGEILIIQRAVSKDTAARLQHPTVDKFMQFIASRAVVEFHNLRNPSEPAIRLELLRDNTYDVVTDALAEQLKVNDAKLLRLTRHNVYAQQPSRHPEKYRGFQRLEQMLSTGATGGTAAGSSTPEIVYYEVLDMPLDELEQLRMLRVSYHNSKTEFVAEHTIKLPRDKTVGDALESLRPTLGAKVATRQLRLLKVAYARIYEIVACDTRIDDARLNDNYWLLRVEAVPDDEVDMDDTDQLLHVCHINFRENKTSSQALHVFGDPFLIRIAAADTLDTLKPRIKAKLNVSDDEFDKWKFLYVANGRHEHIDGRTSLATLTRRTASGFRSMTAEPPFLGLEHDDKGYSKRAARTAASTHSVYDNPISIKK